MMLFNSKTAYGWIAIVMHWLIAIIIFGMFILGLYMTNFLDYYSSLYRTLPDIHKSIGILLLFFLVFRLIWKIINPKPIALARYNWEKWLAGLIHAMIYLLIFAIIISGYFISTIDGRSISVFGWFEIPAVMQLEDMEDIAGIAHLTLAIILIALVVLHSAAALKHHFIDKDSTLLRMLGIKKSS